MLYCLHRYEKFNLLNIFWILMNTWFIVSNWESIDTTFALISIVITLTLNMAIISKNTL